MFEHESLNLCKVFKEEFFDSKVQTNLERKCILCSKWNSFIKVNTGTIAQNHQQTSFPEVQTMQHDSEECCNKHNVCETVSVCFSESQ